jgi:CBS domain-containing protein
MTVQAETRSEAADGRLRLIDLIDDMCAGRDVLFRWVRTARDVMTTDVRALGLDDTVETALEFFRDNDVRHTCVVYVPTEEEGGTGSPRLAGVLSQRDVFRRISPYVGKLGEERTDEIALRQPLGQIVTRNVACASPQTPIPQMIETMVDRRVDMLPVLAEEDVVGMVTAGDITKLFVRLGAIRRIYEGPEKPKRLVDMDPAALLSSTARTVREIMTEQPACLQRQHRLRDAMEAMQEGRFRHIPVVEAPRRLIGIVSDRNVLQYLSFPATQRRPDGEAFRGRLFATEDEDPALDLPVTRIMTRDVANVLPDCSVYEAARMLHERHVSCLPVVDEEENVVGILTVTDLMRALLAVYKLSEALLS